MVTRKKPGGKKGKVKVGKLKLNRETVKDLTSNAARKVKGGNFAAAAIAGAKVGAAQQPKYQSVICNPTGQASCHPSYCPHC